MKSKPSTIKWIFTQCSTFIPWVILISLFNALAAIMYVVLAGLSQQILDNASNTFEHTFMVGSILIFVVIILNVFLEAISSVMLTVVSTKMSQKTKNYMFSKLMRKKYIHISEYHSGDLLNRFSSDIEVVVAGSIGLFPSLISMLTKIVAGFIAICLKNYYFAFAIIIIGFAFPLLGRLLSKKYKFLHKQVQQTEGASRSFLQESIANIIVVKTFTGEKQFLFKLNELLNKNRKLRIKKSIFSVIISTLLYTLFSFGYYGILVWGATQISTGVMTVGTLVYFLQLVSVLRGPLQNISGIIPKYYSMIASAERLIELENLEDENIVKSQDLNTLQFEKIIATNLTFAYTNEIVLKNNNFTIDRGTITAVTGRSGSGKSTLFKLLLGLFPATAGNLSFDNTTLIDESTRQMFSYVPQGNMIISGSIRDNITLCDDSISEEDIINAAKTATIYDFIETLPNGLDTIISERGQGLSEGQIQRIAIARALLFNAPILLLDEATSALDEQTETQLLNNLKNLTNKTILFITHRNTSLTACDKILKLSDGIFSE